MGDVSHMNNTKAIDKMDGRIVEICDWFIEGKTYREISGILGVSLGAFCAYISRPEHSPRVQIALKMSADDYDDKAERVLKEAIGTLPEIMRAKELAVQYRRKAGVRNRAVYGERVDSNVAVEVSHKVSDEQYALLRQGIMQAQLERPKSEDADFE